MNEEKPVFFLPLVGGYRKTFLTFVIFFCSWNKDYTRNDGTLKSAWYLVKKNWIMKVDRHDSTCKKEIFFFFCGDFAV